MLPGSASRAHREMGAAGGFVLLLPDPPVTHEAGGCDGFSTRLTGAGLAESAGAPSCSFWGISDHPSVSLCRAPAPRGMYPSEPSGCFLGCHHPVKHQSGQGGFALVRQWPLDRDVHVWRCFLGTTKAFGAVPRRTGPAWLLHSSISGGRRAAGNRRKHSADRI